MTTEIQILAFATILGFVHLLLTSAAATKQRGVQWNLSSRDGPPPPLVGKTARLERALQNFKETFPFFIAAVVVVSFSGLRGTISEYGSYAYILARLIYIPLYVFNITVVRSLVWGISVVGIFAILAQALL